MGSISLVAPLMSASTAALAHSLSFIPNTKHSHSPLFHHHLWRNTNQLLPEHVPIFLQTSLHYEACVFTLLLTIHFNRAGLQAESPTPRSRHYLKRTVVPAPKACPSSCAKPGNPHAQRNLPPSAAPPASSSP